MVLSATIPVLLLCGVWAVCSRVQGESAVGGLYPTLLNLGAVWPVNKSSSSDLSSTFGPRVLASVVRYDFHRGLDVASEVGEPVRSVLDGMLYGVRYYTGGGLTVIIDHTGVEVDFHGTQKRVTSFYMHLHNVTERLGEVGDKSKQGLAIRAGEVIGHVGMTGSTISPHLHFELRVGVRCSYEYQLKYPTKSCAKFGKDPHVHPLYLFDVPDRETAVSLSVLQPVTATDKKGVVLVSAPDNAPIVNRYELRNGPVSLTMHDVSLREGFDASSTAALDTPDTGAVAYLNPRKFGRYATVWEMVYHVNGDLVSKAEGETLTLYVTDVYNQTTSMVVAGPQGQWTKTR